MKNYPEIKTVHTIVFDFDGVLTDNRVILTETGEEAVACDRGDGLGFNILKKFKEIYGYSFEVYIISTEKNRVVKERCRKLGVECVQGTENKLEALDQLLERRGIIGDKRHDGVVFLGNDLNDYECMKLCGFSIAPVDAHILIKEIADVVLLKEGGKGFARCAIEELVGLDKELAEDIYCR